MRWSVLVPAGAILAVLLAAPARSALADDDEAKTKAACLAAFDDGQKLRLDGKLGRAREQLLFCSRTECPALVREDCAKLVNDVNASQPTVVFAAKDDRGRDLVGVRVTVDGVTVAERLEGNPVELDPGAHRVRYEAAGLPPVDDEFVARAGEKLRRLDVTLRAPRAEAPPPAVRRAPVAGYARRRSRPARHLRARVRALRCRRRPHEVRDCRRGGRRGGRVARGRRVRSPRAAVRVAPFGGEHVLPGRAPGAERSRR
jgi:hypothetical protein